MTDGEPETVVSASLQKTKSIKNPIKHLFYFIYFIKSETCDSFVNHFDGHFAYLKTLDFYFKLPGWGGGGCRDNTWSFQNNSVVYYYLLTLSNCLAEVLVGLSCQEVEGGEERRRAVSYTHLTLPTNHRV